LVLLGQKEAPEPRARGSAVLLLALLRSWRCRALGAHRARVAAALVVLPHSSHSRAKLLKIASASKLAWP